MVDNTVIGLCPICRGRIIEDEPSAACDRFGNSTGDYADTINGVRQSYVGHPGCVVRVQLDPEFFEANA